MRATRKISTRSTEKKTRAVKGILPVIIMITRRTAIRERPTLKIVFGTILTYCSKSRS